MGRRVFTDLIDFCLGANLVQHIIQGVRLLLEKKLSFDQIVMKDTYNKIVGPKFCQVSSLMYIKVRDGSSDIVLISSVVHGTLCDPFYQARTPEITANQLRVIKQQFRVSV